MKSVKNINYTIGQKVYFSEGVEEKYFRGTILKSLKIAVRILNKENKIDYLEYKLKDCVLREDYESAALYRDLIKDTVLIDPLNWIEPFEPEITMDSAPNFPRLTPLSANASITGKPAIVLTENNEFDKSSDTENNVPLFPLTVKISVLPVEPEPCNVIEPDAS